MHLETQIKLAAKSFVFTLLTLLLCLVCVKGTFAADEEDKAMGDGYTNGKTANVAVLGASNVTKPSNAKGEGIDISHWDGTIDFSKLKNDVDYVIIRCGYGSDDTSQDDAKFETYVKGCVKYNIPYGVYLYAHANTAAKAKSEGAHAVRMLKKCASLGGEPVLPVYYDMEDSDQVSVSAANKAKYAKYFCDAVEAAGYESGIYANKYWWTTYLTNSYFNDIKYKWVAQYNTSCTYTGSYHMWQYTDEGKVSGVSGNVDKNYIFTEVPKANYGTTTTTTTAETKNISVSLSTTKYAYTGKAIKPAVTVTYGTKTLTKNTDYKVTYSNNTSTGKAKIVVTGTGDYSGTVTKYFYIVPKKVTGVKSSKGTKSKSAVLKWTKCTGATGYEIAYKRTTSSSYTSTATVTTNKKTFTSLAVKKYNVKVRAYKTIDGKKYYGAYSKVITMYAK